ncbi:hypothetical protein C8Q78DRAFT_977855 [Trametes maxima]|nr:hypothetical protein C8Q78DRAFT_977855 [Trametes maxima]
MWDDEEVSRWNNSSPLEILGVRIPVVYWPLIYQYKRSDEWSRIKQRWLDWKHLIAEYRKLGHDGFWNSHSRDGRMLPLTAIVKALRATRKLENERIAAIAKDELGSDFDMAFSYRKGKEYVVCQRPTSISRLFLQM